MSSPIGPNEIRVLIRPVEARDYDLGPIPAELFKKTFDAFLTALQVTDRELQPRGHGRDHTEGHRRRERADPTAPSHHPPTLVGANLAAGLLGHRSHCVLGRTRRNGSLLRVGRARKAR